MHYTTIVMTGFVNECSKHRQKLAAAASAPLELPTVQTPVL